jgi:phage terminase large subunit
LDVTDQLISRIQSDPLFFLRDILGDDPWEKQIDIAHSIRDHRFTAVRSANGCGKTFILPRIALWFMHAYAPAVVINTAPTWRQVENQYWRNFREAYMRSQVPLGGKLYKTKLEIDEDWFALGLSTDENSTVKFQGWHAKNIMIIFDEASGISPAIYEAARGALSGGQMVRFVLIGNPNSNSGEFYDAFRDPAFNKIHISAFDIPNVKENKQLIPGLITCEWVDEMKAKYGEDSDIYRVRVLGEFPQQASDTLISIDLVEKAFGADRERYGEEEIIGVDVARFGDDESAFVYRKGNFAKVLAVVYGNSTMEIAGKAKVYMKEYKNAKLHVDVVGVGAGVYDRLKEQPDVSARVYGVNNASKPRNEDDYINLRIESWVNTRNWLKDAIMEKHEGFYQLAYPKYKINSNGKMQLESKEDMKKRGVKSPDIADALALTLSRVTEGSNLGITWLKL